MKTPEVCKHGQLRRECEICELEDALTERTTQAQIEKLATEIENLKCCGNCKHYTPRGDCRSKHGYPPGYYCDYWLTSGLTRKDRE